MRRLSFFIGIANMKYSLGLKVIKEGGQENASQPPVQAI